MDGYMIYEVVCKLVGPVEPVTDDERFNNLMELGILFDLLAEDLKKITQNEASMKKAGEWAQSILKRNVSDD